MIDEQVLALMRERMPELLERYYGVTNIIHPFSCPSRDHDDSTPSCKYYPNSQSAWCYGCGRRFDSFDLAGEFYGIGDFKGRVEAVAADLGVSLEGSDGPPRPRPSPKPRPPFDPPRQAGAQDCSEACGLAFGDLYAPGNEVGRRYLRYRGLDDFDASMFGLGFTRYPRTIMGQFSVYEPEALGFITIPFWNKDFTEARYCMVRTISRGAVRNKEWRPKGVASPLYNEWALSAALPVVYVTEGLVDAMAMRKITGKTTVALGGTSNAKRFAQVLYYTEPQMRPAKVIVCMDEDDEGRKTRDRMVADLNAIGVPNAYLQPYPSGAKDAGEWLTNGRGTDWDFFEKPPDPISGLVLFGTKWRGDGR